jgi:CBS domain-containing protein
MKAAKIKSSVGPSQKGSKKKKAAIQEKKAKSPEKKLPARKVPQKAPSKKTSPALSKKSPKKPKSSPIAKLSYPKKAQTAPIKPLKNKATSKRKAGRVVSARKKPTPSGKIRYLLRSKTALEASVPAEIIHDDAPSKNVLRLLEKNNYLAVSKNYKVIGIIGPSNVLGYIKKGDISKATASDFVDTLCVCDMSKSLAYILRKMEEKRLDAIAVTRKEEYIGIITKKSILCHITRTFFRKGGQIGTNIDLFIDELQKGPSKIKDLEKKFEVDREQIEEWIEVLNNQNIMKVEVHFGKVKVAK